METESKATPLARQDHEATIDAFTTALNAAMKEKHRQNGHKIPLAEESAEALREGIVEETREIQKEIYSAVRFGTDPRAVLLEVADRCNYEAEELRRLGALEMEGG